MTAHYFNDLLRRIGQGDTSALEPIYCAYYKSMCCQALWIVRNKHDAEDVASEAVIKIFNYAQSPNCEIVKDAGAFVYTLVRNTALDFMRKRKQTVDIDDADVYVEFGDGLDKAVIYNAMRTLSEQDFKIAQMFYYYDCKIKTIAEAMGMTVSAVKYHLGEIRKKLYEILKKD